MGTLYIIATPIGNLEDITLRSMRMLGSVDILLCEDTRRTGQLLAYIAELIEHRTLSIEHFKFKKPKLISYQEHNEIERIPEVLILLNQDKNVGLVSDAGTPLISDPGFKLVRECVKHHINVVSIPGSSAVISALVSSGLPTDKFTFLGYMPKKEGKRKKILNEIEKSSHTVIFYETAERLNKSLNDIKEVLGDIEIAVCRELTKMHEEVWRGKVSEALSYFEKTKGELVILMNN